MPITHVLPKSAPKTRTRKLLTKTGTKIEHVHSLRETDSRKIRYQSACQTRKKPIPILSKTGTGFRHRFLAPISGTCVMRLMGFRTFDSAHPLS